mgnify:CR=1 FL=1
MRVSRRSRLRLLGGLLLVEQPVLEVFPEFLEQMGGSEVQGEVVPGLHLPVEKKASTTVAVENVFEGE